MMRRTKGLRQASHAQNQFLIQKDKGSVVSEIDSKKRTGQV